MILYGIASIHMAHGENKKQQQSKRQQCDKEQMNICRWTIFVQVKVRLIGLIRLAKF